MMLDSDRSPLAIPRRMVSLMNARQLADLEARLKLTRVRFFPWCLNGHFALTPRATALWLVRERLHEGGVPS